MPFDNGETVVMMYRPQHRNVRVMLDDGAQFGFVTRATELVENDAGDANILVERLITQDQRGDAAGHAARIDDQYHGGLQQGGQCRIAVTAVEAQAVIQPLVGFDQ